MWLVLGLLVSVAISASGQNEPAEVSISQGVVIGSRAENENYYEFYGIPYADSTAGSHRFKAPSPPPSFNEPFTANQKNIRCVRALGTGHEGIEDCLVTNIFTPSLDNNRSLPVMVWIKGKEFDPMYEQERTFKIFMKHDVVVVSLNFRESIFGFLCLGTETAPGNAGLKDILAGLRWVRRNIDAFGGNPDDITLFGHGSGAAAVDLITLSPMAEGLIHKAISQSGNALAPWAVSRDNLKYAIKVAEALGHVVNSIETLSEVFTRTSVAALMDVINQLDLTDNSLAFAPCIENPYIENGTPFLIKSPYESIVDGDFLQIPFMMGFVDYDGTVRIEEANGSDWIEKIQSSFIDFIQPDLKFISKEQEMEVSQTIKRFYFTDITNINLNQYLKYHSETMIVVPSIREALLRSRISTESVFLYQFSYKGELGQKFVDSFRIDGATHSEELAYLFYDESDKDISPSDYTVGDILAERWTNFAKTGDPTSDISQIQWMPFTTDDPNYLRFIYDDISLDHETTLEYDLKGPHADAINFWNPIYNEYFRDAQGKWTLTEIDDDENDRDNENEDDNDTESDEIGEGDDGESDENGEGDYTESDESSEGDDGESDENSEGDDGESDESDEGDVGESDESGEGDEEESGENGEGDDEESNESNEGDVVESDESGEGDEEESDETGEGNVEESDESGEGDVGESDESGEGDNGESDESNEGDVGESDESNEGDLGESDESSEGDVGESDESGEDDVGESDESGEGDNGESDESNEGDVGESDESNEGDVEESDESGEGNEEESDESGEVDDEESDESNEGDVGESDESGEGDEEESDESSEGDDGESDENEDNDDELPKVSISQGDIIGSKATDGTYFEFHGIPYADSTSGSHRFKAPSPPPSFTEPFEANRRNIRCVRALGVGYEGTEDCLVANIFTPSLDSSRMLPVMVWIKGKEFDVLYEQDRTFNNFMKQDVVVVSLNFRESIFGFLCLGTETAPGNAGLKDIIAGLRWIQENIDAFGGNPDDITLFGHGSGAAAVDLITFSPMAEGLIHKAISQSGNAFAPWAVSRNNLEYAIQVAEALGHIVDSIETLVGAFTRSSVATIMAAINELDLTDNSLAFAPCLENPNLENGNPFLIKSPYESIGDGDFLNIPFMMGFVDYEGTIRAEEAIRSDWIERMESSFIDFIQPDLIFDTDDQKIEVSESIKNFYFTDVTNIDISQYLQYHGDTMIMVSSIREARLRSNFSTESVYLYQFSYKGDLGQQFADPFVIDSAAHSEELAYLFYKELNTDISPIDYAVGDILVERWTNFAKTGNPASDTSVIWLPFTVDEPNYIRFLDADEVNFDNGATLEVSLIDPHPEITNFWDHIYHEHFMDAKSKWTITVREEEEEEEEEEDGSEDGDEDDEDCDEDDDDCETDSASTAVGYTFLILSFFGVLSNFHSQMLL